MTWEDELRALDQQLASGALTPDGYQEARDRLFRAYGGAERPPAGDPAGHPQPQQPVDPFPPPLRWPAEPTQVVRPTPPGPPDPGEQTQVVSDFGSSERTQVVQPSRTPYQEQPWPGPQVGGWPAPQHGQEPAPPWADSNFSPGTPWAAQGPEVFDVESPRTGRIVAIVVGVIVLLGLAGGIWYSIGVNKPPAAQTTHVSTTSASTSSTPKHPEPPAAKPAPTDSAAALVKPPGTPRIGGGRFDLSTAASGLLPKPVTTVLSGLQMTDGLLNTTTSNNITMGVMAFAVNNEEAAKTAADSYATAQKEGGLSLNEGLSLVGVPVYSSPANAGNSVYRAVYVLYNRVVIVEAYAAAPDEAETAFKQLLSQQLELAPPTVRSPK